MPPVVGPRDVMLEKPFEQTIKELSEEILSEPEPQALANKILAHLQDTFQVAWSTLWLTEQNRTKEGKQLQLRLAAATGGATKLLTAENGKPAVYDFGQGLTGYIAEKHEKVNIEKPSDFEKYKNEHARKYDQVMYGKPRAGGQCRCVLGVPLILKSKSSESVPSSDELRVIGVLKLENIKPTKHHPENYFTKADERIVDAYAAVIAVALEKTRMREDSIRLGQGLMEISKNLMGQRGKPPDLDNIVEETAKVISAQACALWLRRGQQLHLKAEFGYPGGKKNAQPYPLEVLDPQGGLTADRQEWEREKYKGCGLTVYGANTQQPLNLKTAKEVTGHFAWRGANDRTMWGKPHGQACYSLVQIPLIDEETEELKGVFKIENKTTIFKLPSYFTDEDERLLTSLGNAISLSLIISERFERHRRLENLISNLRVLDGLDVALFFLLTGLTHGAGLEYNRAMVFLRDEINPNRLVCQFAKGHLSAEDWGRDMQEHPPAGDLDLDKEIQSFLADKHRHHSTPMMKRWHGKHVRIDDVMQILGQRAANQRSANQAAKQADTQKYLSGTDLDPQDLLYGFPHGDFVLIPIWIEQKYRGVIYADNRFTGNRINQFECHVLDLFAGMAGAVIQASQVPSKLREESRQAWQEFSQPAAHRLGTEANEINSAITARLQKHFRNNMRELDGVEFVPVSVVTECLKPIEQSVKRLWQAKGDYSQLTPVPEDPQQFDLCELIANVVEATTKGPTPMFVQTEFRAEPIMVMARREGLKYVFEELLLNALKEVDESDQDHGSVQEKSTIRVKIEVRREGPRVSCIVCDDGRGISEEVRERLFKRPVSGRKGGTGLGMFIINKRIQENGGTIRLFDLFDVKPETYPGACFEIILPALDTISPIRLAVKEVKPEAAGDSSARSSMERLPVGHFPVLVVEDTRNARRDLEDLLRNEGMKVLAARNEYEAIGKVYSEEVAVIVADINLAEELGQPDGGVVLAERLVQMKRRIPIILISQTPEHLFPTLSHPEQEEKKKKLNIRAVLNRHPTLFSNKLLHELRTILQELADFTEYDHGDSGCNH